MKNKNIAKLLFTIAGISSAQAMASLPAGDQQFFLPEQLPLKARALVYQKANEILNQNPEIADEDAIVAVDREGNVYVLDKNIVEAADHGEPSCRGGGK